MNPIGKTTINPVLFYSGKVCGYVTWILFAASAAGMLTVIQPHETLRIPALIGAGIGLFIVIISLVNLGSSTRLGLPEENTAFKEDGLYRFSRNPMYLGFNLLTLSSMLFCADILVAVAGIYSMAVYHLIILGEEAFLKQRFGEVYLEYMRRVRRYV